MYAKAENNAAWEDKCQISFKTSLASFWTVTAIIIGKKIIIVQPTFSCPSAVLWYTCSLIRYAFLSKLLRKGTKVLTSNINCL